MNETEIEVTLAQHQKEIGSLKHRMDDTQKVVDVVHQLAQEMVGLTKEVGFMNRNLSVLTAKVAEMESRPGKRWESVIVALIGAAVGAFVSKLF